MNLSDRLRVFNWKVLVGRLVSTVAMSINAVSGIPLLTGADAYANGGDITVEGSPGDSFTVLATGTPYITNENTETSDELSESVERYGARELALTGNDHITSVTQAQEIAALLLSFYGGVRNDGAINWFGSTLVAVGDTLEVVEFKSDTVETKAYFLIKRQTTTFDGSIQTQTELRRDMT